MSDRPRFQVASVPPMHRMENSARSGDRRWSEAAAESGGGWPEITWRVNRLPAGIGRCAPFS